MSKHVCKILMLSIIFISFFLSASSFILPEDAETYAASGKLVSYNEENGTARASYFIFFASQDELWQQVCETETDQYLLKTYGVIEKINMLEDGEFTLYTDTEDVFVGLAGKYDTSGSVEYIKPADGNRYVLPKGSYYVYVHTTWRKDSNTTTSQYPQKSGAVYASYKYYHTYGEWQILKEPTCKVTGYRSTICTGCGKTIKEVLPLTDHKWGDWIEIIPARCTTEGTLRRTCKVCNTKEEKKVPAKGHVWGEWNVVTEPTPFKEGEEKRVCSICKATEHQAIPVREMTDDEIQSQAVVVKYLSAAKQYEVKKMQSCFANKKSKAGYPTKKVAWIFKKYNKNMSWEITSISESGSNYRVGVTVKHPTIYQKTYTTFYNALEWALNKYLNGKKTPSGNAIANRFFKKLNQKVRKDGVRMTTEEYRFYVKNTSNGWKIKKKNRTLVDIATAVYNEGTDDALKDFKADYR